MPCATRQKASQPHPEALKTGIFPLLPWKMPEASGQVPPTVSVTVGDLITAFPYSNTLYLKKVTPQILYQVMEVSARMLDGRTRKPACCCRAVIPAAFFRSPALLWNIIRMRRPEAGSRPSLLTDRMRLLPGMTASTQLLMVSNNYIMSGGKRLHHAGFPGKKYGEAGGELEVIQAYLEKSLADGTIASYARAQERILLRGSGYEPRDYTASIRITDEAGNPLPEKELSYRVDGGERVNGTTDADGYLKIQVSDGSTESALPIPRLRFMWTIMQASALWRMTSGPSLR